MKKGCALKKKRINYYPFGLQHKGYNNITRGRNHNWDYLGQERQEELGLNWHSYKWRNADPAIGRFFGVDPITEDYPNQTPYQFASNNPVWKIEIEGLEGYAPTGNDIINGPGYSIGHVVFNPEEDYNGSGRQEPATYATYELPSQSGGGQLGIINPAPEGAYSENPVLAFAVDATYIALSFIGADAVDDAIATNVDPDASTSQKVQAAVNVIPALVKGGKGPKTAPRTMGPPAAKPLKNQALDVKNKLNNGKNSVHVKTPNGLKRFDLDGKAHGGVETPHVQSYKVNTNPKTGQTNLSRTSKQAESMTQQDIRTVKKVLKNRTQNGS